MCTTPTMSVCVWEAARSVFVRWPGKEEDEINNLIDSTYPSELATLPFFTKNGEKAFLGPPTNRRILMVKQHRYKKRLSVMGLRMQDRSEPSGFLHESDPEKIYLMAGKQLAFAVYLAIQEWPTNQQILAIVDGGRPVRMYPKLVPTDVQQHIVWRSNQMHDGASLTWLGTPRHGFLNTSGLAPAQREQHIEELCSIG